jgi:hypothetical protein
MKYLIIMYIFGIVLFPTTVYASICVCTNNKSEKSPFREDTTGCNAPTLQTFFAPADLPISCSVVECYESSDCSDNKICNSNNSCTVPPPAPTPVQSENNSTEYVQLVNPIGGTEQNKDGITSIEVIIGNIISAALGVAGSIALVAFVFGAFTWLTSAGKSDKIQQGAQIMIHAAIGLFIIFASYGILNQVIQALTS